MTAPLVPLAAPKALPVDAGSVHAGSQVLPIDRLRIMSPDTWEDFVLEWADSLRDRYGRVERCGGAGDMGRDVTAFEAVDSDVWDNFQCKHYASGLMPSDIWIELGKLLYYTFSGAYSRPRRYFFVSPRGVGTSLSNLLREPDKLRDGLRSNWDRYCLSGITAVSKVPLEGDLLSYFEDFDFNIFDSVPPLTLIEEHASTRYHIPRFGGGLPPRPTVQPPPEGLQEVEARYVRALCDAYGDYLGKQGFDAESLVDHPDLRDHFHDARYEFFSAEALRAFSRDALPEGEYERLQDDVHQGIKTDLRASFPNGYDRVLAVVKTANLLPLTGSPLLWSITQRDRGGICHQLANDGAVTWVRV